MNKEEYNQKFEQIESKANAEKRALNVEYAIANNSIKAGDKIKDIKGQYIEVISMYPCIIFNSNYPEMRYRGFKLKKDGTRFKSEETCDIYQSQLL